jgi:hypothetical protein
MAEAAPGSVMDAVFKPLIMSLLAMVFRLLATPKPAVAP